MEILIFFLGHWYLSLFFQTMMHHRYAAHGMFTMSKTWEKVFIFLAYLAQGSSYLSPRAYGILHRMHHANADTEEDVHSPIQIEKAKKPLGKLFGSIWMMVETARIYDKIDKGEKVFNVNIIRPRSISVEKRFEQSLPYYPRFDYWGQSLPSRLVWGGLYLLFYIIFATSWWMFLLLPVHWLMGPIHGLIINWFTHKYGYRNYETSDTSSNLLIPMLGENLHNNHHGEPANANFARRWWEIDLSYWVLWFLNKVKVIKFKKK